jgi:hypothetical protein
VGERDKRTVGNLVGRILVGVRVFDSERLGASVSEMGRPDRDVGDGVFAIGAGVVGFPVAGADAGVVGFPVAGADVSEIGAGVGTFIEGTDCGDEVGVLPGDSDEIGCDVVKPNGGRVNIESLVGSDSDATGAGLFDPEEVVSSGVGGG